MPDKGIELGRERWEKGRQKEEERKRKAECEKGGGDGESDTGRYRVVEGKKEVWK